MGAATQMGSTTRMGAGAEGAGQGKAARGNELETDEERTRRESRDAGLDSDESGDSDDSDGRLGRAPKFHWSSSRKSSTANTAKMHVTKTSITSDDTTGNSAAKAAHVYIHVSDSRHGVKRQQARCKATTGAV